MTLRDNAKRISPLELGGFDYAPSESKEGRAYPMRAKEYSLRREWKSGEPVQRSSREHR